MHNLGLLIEICSLSLVAYHGRTRGFFSKIQVDMLRLSILLDLWKKNSTGTLATRGSSSRIKPTLWQNI